MRHQILILARIPLIFGLLATLGCDTSLGQSEARKCDLVSNDRCEPGEMCVDATDEECVPAGAVAVDATCATDADCVATAVCASDGETKVCKTKCDYTASKCDSGLECHQHESVTTPDHLGYCAPPVCNPVANTGCGKDKVCMGGSKPRCADGGTAKDGEACSDNKDCAAQTTCIGSTKKCTKLCYASKNSPENLCGEKDTCIRLLDVNGDDLPQDQGTCKKPCHSVTDEGCKATQACHGASSVTPPQCGPFGEVAVNDFCLKNSDCVKAAICVPLGNGKFKCKSKCDTGKNDGNSKNPGCATDQICIVLKDSETGDGLPNKLGACGP